jgi:hypothetical protein
VAERPSLSSATDPDSLVQQRVGVFGAALVSTRRNLIDARLGPTAITGGRWISGTTGSGNVSFSGLSATVVTGTTAGSTAFLQTSRPVTFLLSYENEFSAILQLIGHSVADNRLRWGVFDANDGIFFEVRAGEARIVTRKGGVDTVIPQPSFNGSHPFVLGTDRFGYGIRYLAAFAQFVQGYNLVHQEPISPVLLTGPLVNNATLPIRLEAANLASAQNVGFVADAVVAQRWAIEEALSAMQIRRGSFNVGTTPTTVIQSDTSRIRLLISNRGQQDLFVRLGAPASATDYDFVVQSGVEFVPLVRWGGEVSVIRGSGTGMVSVVEFLP